LPIIGAEAKRIGKGRKTYNQFRICLKKWAKETEEEEEEEEEEVEEEEEEEKVELLLREVAHNILHETDTEGKNLEQVKQIFSI